MANILYLGQSFTPSEEVDVDELADVILATYGKGVHSWVTMDLAGDQPKSVRLLVGPGIPVAIIE
jgi:hypothetical protein